MVFLVVASPSSTPHPAIWPSKPMELRDDSWLTGHVVTWTKITPSPAKKSTSYGSHSLNWGQGVNRMALPHDTRHAFIPVFQSLEWFRWDHSSQGGHQLCLSRCQRIYIYLWGPQFHLARRAGGKWEGAGARKLRPRLLIYTPLPRLSVLCEAARIMSLRLSCAGFPSSADWRTTYASHLPAWKAIVQIWCTIFWLIEEYTGLIPTHRAGLPPKRI